MWNVSNHANYDGFKTCIVPVFYYFIANYHVILLYKLSRHVPYNNPITTYTYRNALIGEFHDNVLSWKCSPRYRPFVRWIHWSLVARLATGHWWFPSQRTNDVVFWCLFVVNKLLNKQSRCWLFERSRSSCDVTVMLCSTQVNLAAEDAVAYFPKHVNPSLAKPSLNFSVGIASVGIWVKFSQ